MQLIDGGKTMQSLPRYQILTNIYLSVKWKHFSNNNGPVKLLNEIILPYV